MKPLYLTILTLILAGVVSYATTKALQPSALPTPTVIKQEKTKESAYDRVMRTGKLRCGYIVWPPFLSKNPNTSEYSGFIYDFVAALSDAMELDFEMTEEFSLATFLQDLNNGRYDVECSGGWSNARRGKQAEYTIPIAYFPIVAVGHVDQNSSADGTLNWVNNPTIKVAIIDGETSSVIHRRAFPKAQTVELPSMQNSSDLLMQISTKKADVTFTDMPSVLRFQKSNPNKIKIFSANPVRVIPINMTLPAGEFRLKGTLDTAIQELLNDGVVDKILDKYDPENKILLRLEKPYQVGK